MARSFLSALTGSFAFPAAENPTVVMMEAAYRHHRIDARYLNCEVTLAALGDAVLGARAMGWAGFNCSLPHKRAVVQHLDGLAESAQLIGAVNCVVREGTRLIGHNFDGQGFVESVRTVADPLGASILVLGAGGAARAVAVEAALAGAERITVASRNALQGGELAALVSTRTPARCEVTLWEGPFQVPRDVDLMVDATSAGLYPDVDDMVDVDLESLRAGLLVADVVANPPHTRLLREAELVGCRTLDGLGMLVNQGALAIQLWTGVAADKAVMRAALAEVLEPAL